MARRRPADTIYQGERYTRAGFSNWIDYDQKNNVIKYGTYTFNPAEVFGLKVTDKGSYEDHLERQRQEMAKQWGPNAQMIMGLLGFGGAKTIGQMAGIPSQQTGGIGDWMKRDAWEKSRKQFTWTDPATGKVYNETGSGDTLLPMSKQFAQMISDATWANRTNVQTSRWGKDPSGVGKDPNSKKPTNNSGGKAPTKGLLV